MTRIVFVVRSTSNGVKIRHENERSRVARDRQHSSPKVKVEVELRHVRARLAKAACECRRAGLFHGGRFAEGANYDPRRCKTLLSD
jgi:hypothetical protein